MWRTDLSGDALRCLLVSLDNGETFAQALLGEILERADNLLGPVLLVRGEQKIHVVSVGPSLAQHQVAADPFPDRIERGARDASDMFALRHIIHQERLDGSEEQSLRVADARQL